MAQTMPGAKSMVVDRALTSAVRVPAVKEEVRSSVVMGIIGGRNNVVQATAFSGYAAHVLSGL